MASLMTRNGGICRLCLEVHCNDFETIDHATTAVILNILNLTMDLAISDEPVMCKNCSRSVEMAFDFKSTCLFNGRTCYVVCSDQQTSHFHLKDVYKELKSLVTANDSVCRFCMTCSETSNFLCLDVMKEEGLVSQKMLDLYLPEIDYNIVELLVCRSCVGSLVSYLKFATVCATTEETITENHERIHTNSQDLVALNRMFCKENKNECEILRKRTLNIRSNDRPIKNYKTKHKGNLKNHLLVHRENSDVEMYECETCNFKTKHKESLKRHLLVHREYSKLEMYECEMCHYKAKRKGDLKNHILVHRENSEVEMYECKTCHFKTKRKRSLKIHLLVHEGNFDVEIENSEVEMYECKTCNFKTKHKGYLKTHLLVHEENSDVVMYECETCHYKTKRKGDLKKSSFGSQRKF
ncbi:hypothetical protein NQ317_001911 [Molorchus minor]|uniref:C2H2-type domain-containing protein n=1 Tax=Molorchus minor TaxID=1323400 RepID=A0ABQ9JEA4_9CUCU|nr:hypothetical protein NQ317_001911 [Molorchus minor]